MKKLLILLLFVSPCFSQTTGGKGHSNKVETPANKTTFSIADYAHLYDGSDHTAAFKAVVEAAEAVSGTAYLPSGVWNLTINNGQTLCSVSNPIRVIGAGPGLTTIVDRQDSAHYVFICTTNDDSATYWEFSGFTLKGAIRNHVGTGFTPRFLWFGGTDTVNTTIVMKDIVSEGYETIFKDNSNVGVNFFMDRCEFSETGGGVMQGYGTGNCSYTITNCIFYKIGIETYRYANREGSLPSGNPLMGAHILYFKQNGNTITVDNCYFGYNPHAPDSSEVTSIDTAWSAYAITGKEGTPSISPTDRMTITNCTFWASPYNGLSLGVEVRSPFTYISDCYFHGLTSVITPKNGLNMHITLENCYIDSCGFLLNVAAQADDNMTTYINNVKYTTNWKDVAAFQITDTCNVHVNNSEFKFTGDSASIFLYHTKGEKDSSYFKFTNSTVIDWKSNGDTGSALDEDFMWLTGGDIYFENNRFLNIWADDKFAIVNSNGKLFWNNNEIHLKDASETEQFSFNTLTYINGKGNSFYRAGSEFNINPIMNPAAVTSGGVNFRKGEYGDTLRSNISDQLILSPNYDTYYYQSADSGDVDNFYVYNTTVAGFKGAEFTVVGIDSLWFSSGGNIIPDSTTARPAGSVATFFYDDLANKWRER